MPNNKKLLQSIQTLVQEIRESQDKNKVHNNYFAPDNQKAEQKLK